MANEFIVQHGLIVTDDGATQGVLTFDDGSGGQVAKLIFDYTTDTFSIEIDGETRLESTKTTTIIAGDLTINGTTTIIDSVNLVVTDNTITVNDGEVGAGVTAGAAGILVDRGTETKAGWFFNESGDWWGPTGPSGVGGEGGATQKIGNISVIDSTDSPQEVLTITSTGAIRPPTGTTLERPTIALENMFRYNTDLAALEVYDGTDWAKVQASAVGAPIAVTGDIDLTNTFSILNPPDPAAGNEVGDMDFNDGRYMRGVNNFTEIVADGSIATARTNLDVYSKAEAVAVAGDTMTGDLNIAADILPDSTANLRDIGSLTKKFQTMYATTFNGEATSALYADLAERYEADREYEPGTVVIFGGEAEVTTTSTYADTRVAGVVSTKPAFKMNSGAGFSDTHPYVALKGKVPCKIMGPVKKGDLIMTSKIPGYGTAVKHGPTKPYTAFARANEDSDKGMSVINVSII